MSEINVTPFVDVMLVLLIVFMVSAPLLTVGVPINLPQSQAKSLSQNTDPLTVAIDGSRARSSCRMPRSRTTNCCGNCKRLPRPAAVLRRRSTSVPIRR